MKVLFSFLFLWTLISHSALADEEENFQSPGDGRELSKEDRAILEAGPITRKKYITGGVTGSVLGFGTGHLIHGKWKEAGWYYTAAQVGFFTLMMIGQKKNASDTFSTGFNGNFDGSNYALMITGYVGFIASRVGEIFDVWNRPYEHNQRYKELSSDNPLANIQVFPVINREKMGLGLAYAF